MRPTIPLIEALYKCADACDYSAHILLEEQEPYLFVSNIKAQMDCSETCRFTARLISRHSLFVNEAVELCIAACFECASECEKQSFDHCRTTAKFARKCDGECRQFIVRGL